MVVISAIDDVKDSARRLVARADAVLSYFGQELPAFCLGKPLMHLDSVVKLLRERFSVDPCVVTGPATDNAVVVDIIKSQMCVAAFNAMTDGAALGDRVIEAIGVKARVSPWTARLQQT